MAKTKMIPPPPGSVERRSSRRKICARTWLMLVPACFALALSSTPAIALGQGEHTHEMMTEIWMTGTGVALWRRVPQDRELVHPHEDDQFARSMLMVAQQRLDRGDQKTAKWLARCARDLTDGRIGPETSIENPRNGIDSETCAMVASVTANPRRLPDGAVWRPIYVEVHPPVSIPEDEAETGGAGGPDWHAIPAVIEDNVDSLPADEIGPIPRARTPVGTTGEPITIGVISFATGVIFCVSLCAILRFVPSRSTRVRRAELPSDMGRNTTEPTVPADEVEIRDHSSWFIEDFYSKNVELYGQLAQGG